MSNEWQQSQDTYDNQVEGHHVIQNSWIDQYYYAGKQR